MRSKFGLFLAVLTLGEFAGAEDASTQRARDEVESRLRQMVPPQPARFELFFEGLDEPNLKLSEVEVLLDGVPLPLPPLETLAQPGRHPIQAGAIAAGKHAISSRVVYAEVSSVMVSNLAGYKWKLPAKTTFLIQPGLSVSIKVAALTIPDVTELREKFKLVHEVEAAMVGEADDGKMPEPFDAGTALAAKEKPAPLTGVLEAPPPTASPRMVEAIGAASKAPAVATVVSGRRKTVDLVGFRQGEGTSTVFVKTNEPVSYRLVESGPTTLVFELENTRLARTNDQRALDTSFFSTVVKKVRPYSSKSTLKVEVLLKQSVKYRSGQTGNEVWLELPRP